MSRLPASLDLLDGLLVDLHAAQQRPKYRKRFFADLAVPGSVAGIRLLRTVEQAGPSHPTIGDVAAHLAVEPSTASRNVDVMVRAGFLVRHNCQQDRRCVRLQLTDFGRSLLSRATSRRRELLNEITEPLSDPEIELLVGFLQRVQSGFDKLEDQG